MMPSFAPGRSNNAGLVEGKRTENSPWVFQAGRLMAMKKVKDLSPRCTTVYPFLWPSWFPSSQLWNRQEIIGKIYLLFTYFAVVMYLAVRKNGPFSNAQPGCPPLSEGPVHKPIQIFFNSQRFLCGFGFSLRVSGESGMRVRNFLNRRSPKWKFLNANESKIVWTLNPDMFFSIDH